MTNGFNGATHDGVIESASATTSSDNANSGPFAYVFTGVVLVASIALATAFGSSLASIVDNAASTYRTETPRRDYDYLDDYLDDDYYDDYFDEIDELEDLLREYQR